MGCEISLSAYGETQPGASSSLVATLKAEGYVVHSKGNNCLFIEAFGDYMIVHECLAKDVWRSFLVKDTPKEKLM